MWNWNQLGSVLQTISSSIEFYCISLRRKLQTSVEESCLLPGGKTPLKASTECWTTPVNISKIEIIRNTWTFIFLTVFLCFTSLLPSLQLHASALLRYKRMHIYLYPVSNQSLPNIKLNHFTLNNPHCLEGFEAIIYLKKTYSGLMIHTKLDTGNWNSEALS